MQPLWCAPSARTPVDSSWTRLPTRIRRLADPTIRVLGPWSRKGVVGKRSLVPALNSPYLSEVKVNDSSPHKARALRNSSGAILPLTDRK